MAFVITDVNPASSTRASAYGDGLKQVIYNFSAQSGDTSATITIPQFTTLFRVLVLGGRVMFTNATTYSGNQVTFKMSIPAQGAVGTLIALGK